MEIYSAIRKNDTMWFEGKWIQLEDIMLNEVSQAQKTKASCFLSSVYPKINIYTKPNVIIYICRTCL
jgi:hypothetical protein